MAPLIDLHGQHDHQQLLDSGGTFTCSTRSSRPSSRAGRRRDVRGRPSRRRTGARGPERWTSESVRPGWKWHAFSWPRSHRVAPESAKTNDWPNERHVLQNVDRLRTRCPTHAYDELYDAEDAALTRLARVWRDLERTGRPGLPPAAHLSARDAVQPVLEDLALALRNYQNDTRVSPERLQQVEDRLAGMSDSRSKYGPSLADVLAPPARRSRRPPVCWSTRTRATVGTRGVCGIARAVRSRPPVRCRLAASGGRPRPWLQSWATNSPVSRWSGPAARSSLEHSRPARRWGHAASTQGSCLFKRTLARASARWRGLRPAVSSPA